MHVLFKSARAKCNINIVNEEKGGMVKEGGRDGDVVEIRQKIKEKRDFKGIFSKDEIEYGCCNIYSCRTYDVRRIN